MLDLLVQVSARDRWGPALSDQVGCLVGVAGTFWRVDLILEGTPTPVPWGTPVPIARSLALRPGASFVGSVTLWVDRESGVIDCLELAVVTESAVDHYPRPGDLEEVPSIVNPGVRTSYPQRTTVEMIRATLLRVVRDVVQDDLFIGLVSDARWSLGVECRWLLEIDGRTVTEDSVGHDEQMARLRGRSVVAVHSDSPENGHDPTFEFDDGTRLSLFADGDIDPWSMNLPDIVLVGPGDPDEAVEA